jgi:hypothetical protein
MASVLDQLQGSTLSLQGNGFNAIPTPGSTTTPSWGYVNGSDPIPNPYNSELQDTYSVDGNPNERIVDFNRQALGGVTAVKPPATLDELDPNAPNNTQAGLAGGVVSQIYKSAAGRKYKDLGPQPGRY